jgi:hypothetical protein
MTSLNASNADGGIDTKAQTTSDNNQTVNIL